MTIVQGLDQIVVFVRKLLFIYSSVVWWQGGSVSNVATPHLQDTGFDSELAYCLYGVKRVDGTLDMLFCCFCTDEEYESGRPLFFQLYRPSCSL